MLVLNRTKQVPEPNAAAAAGKLPGISQIAPAEAFRAFGQPAASTSVTAGESVTNVDLASIENLAPTH